MTANIFGDVYKRGGGGSLINPVISEGYSLQTLVEGHCRNHYTVPGANNQGSICMTLKTAPIGFKLRRLGIHAIQGVGASGFRLVCKSRTGVPIARTGLWGIANTSQLGERFIEVSEVWNGAFYIPGTEVDIAGGVAYYWGIYCPQASSSARFIGDDVSTTFGVKPWISWTADNLGAGGDPGQMPAGYETSTRLLIMGAT